MNNNGGQPERKLASGRMRRVVHQLQRKHDLAAQVNQKDQHQHRQADNEANRPKALPKWMLADHQERLSRRARESNILRPQTRLTVQKRDRSSG